MRGGKELFKGLAIEQLEKEWTPYSVLHFDMSLGKHMERDAFVRYWDSSLSTYERESGLTSRASDANIRLTALI